MTDQNGWQPIETAPIIRPADPTYPGAYADWEGSIYAIVKGKLKKRPERTDVHGYVRVRLPDAQQYLLRDEKKHKLVCTAWHGPKPFNGAVVRHLNDNKNDNSPGNLAWGTNKQNSQDYKKIVPHMGQWCSRIRPPKGAKGYAIRKRKDGVVYEVRTRKQQKLIWIGLFKTKQEAESAYAAALKTCKGCPSEGSCNYPKGPKGEEG